MKVIFNADDFGLTKGISDGIIQAHVDGVVNSTTLMMNGQAVDYAVNQAKLTPTLAVGIHLVLTYGKPILRNVSAIVDQTGYFKFTKTTSGIDQDDLAHIELEWRAQLEAFIATGLVLDHIDSHHHVHGWPELKELVIKLASEYQVPVRYVDTLKEEKQLLYTEKLWLDFYQEGATKDIFTAIQGLNTPSIEVMTHPAIIDEDLKKVSSYVDDRKRELDILRAITVPEWVSN